MGDINVEIFFNDLHANELKTLFSTYNSENSIHVPTIITTQSATMLDIRVTNLEPHEFHAGVLSCDLSDHLPLFFIAVPLKKTKDPYGLPHPRRKITDATLQCFVRLIERLD